MKRKLPHIGFARLCGWFGLTRQAYYQNNWEAVSTTIDEELIIQKVKEVRKTQPRIGFRKILEIIKPFLNENKITIGRDALFTLLSVNQLLIRKRKRRVQTTNSYHWLRKHPNLIKGFVPSEPNQLWVSDITYWRINTGEHLYISL